MKSPSLLHWAFFFSSGYLVRVASWLPSSHRHGCSTVDSRTGTITPCRPSRWFPRSAATTRPVIDADFERVEKGNFTQGTDFEGFASKSLLQLSLESDPDWNETRIPFMDGNNFIDVKLAFMAELDGVQYGIGIPFDHAAAVTIERKDGSILTLSPEDEESEELIKIMASQLQEHVGKDLTLKQTPRILTIQGPLEKYTKDWKERVTPKPFDSKTLLDDKDENLSFFHDFMRKELGEKEYQKIMQDDDDEDDDFGIDDELLGIFQEASNIRTESLDDLFPDDDNDDLFIKEMEEFVSKDISHDGVALKVLSYSLADGNKYSVVQPLQAVALVGKYTENDDDIRFDLLTPEEAELVIPRLEKACKDDLEKAGLTAQDIAK